MTQKLILERPLSLYENFFRCRTANKFYKTFQLTGTYSKKLTKSNLSSAVRKLLLDYHILACNVYRGNGLYNITPLEQIKFDDVFLDMTGEESRFLHEGQLNENGMKFLNQFEFEIYVNKPLFKLVLLNDFNLSVVFDHTLYDGVVASNFHEILLEKLSENDEEHVDIIFDYKTDKHLITHSLPPPIDDYLPDWEVDYSDNDPQYFDKVVPPGLTKFPGRFPNSRDYTFSFKLTHFSPDEMKKILHGCKKRGVTLTSFLQYVTILSFQPVFKNHYTANRVAIALRRHFSAERAPDYYKHFFDYNDYKNMGNLPHLGLAQNYPPLFKFDWEEVKQANKNLLKAVNNNKLLNLSKTFKDRYDPNTDNENLFGGLGGNKAETSKLSNLGFVKVKEYGNWTIDNLVFSQDTSPTTADLMINVVSCPRGGLNIVTSYNDHSFQDTGLENFDMLMKNFRDNVIKYTTIDN